MLQATAEPVRAIPEIDRIDVVADAGCVRTEDIDADEKVGLTPHVRCPQRGWSARNGFFRKGEFRYDAGGVRRVEPHSIPRNRPTTAPAATVIVALTTNSEG